MIRLRKRKLSSQDVLDLRQFALEDWPITTLSLWFGISDNAIWQVLKGRTYKHVGGPLLRDNRSGRRWTYQELKFIVANASSNCSIEELCEALNRSQDAVRKKISEYRMWLSVLG